MIAQVVDDGPGISPEDVRTSSSRSTRRKRSGRGPGSASRCRTASCRSTAGGSPSRVGRARRASPSSCPCARRARARAGSRRWFRSRPAGVPRSSWRTSRRCLDLVVTLLTDPRWHVDVAAGGKTRPRAREGAPLRPHRLGRPHAGGGGDEFYRKAIAHDPGWRSASCSSPGTRRTPPRGAFSRTRTCRCSRSRSPRACSTTRCARLRR